jgi:hypothetical protein
MKWIQLFITKKSDFFGFFQECSHCTVETDTRVQNPSINKKDYFTLKNKFRE